LFDDARYKIDVSPFSSTARLVFNVKKYLKIIGASLTANFKVEAVIFSLTSAQMYLEVYLRFLKERIFNNLNRMWKF